MIVSPEQPATSQEKPIMTDDHIKQTVSRFLAWKLPSDFHPDAGITFKAAFNEHTDHPMTHEPTGTNLFTATQAEAMIRHLVGDSRPATNQAGEVERISKADALAVVDRCTPAAAGGAFSHTNSMRCIADDIRKGIAALAPQPATAQEPATSQADEAGVWAAMEKIANSGKYDWPDGDCEQVSYIVRIAREQVKRRAASAAKSTADQEKFSA